MLVPTRSRNVNLLSLHGALRQEKAMAREQVRGAVNKVKGAFKEPSAK